MNKPGLTLIELVLGLAIGALLMTVVFNVLTVLSTTVRRAEPTMDIHVATALFTNQFTKDIQGTFVPLYPERKKTKKEEEKKQALPKEGEKQPAAQTQEKKEEKGPKPLKKVFDCSVSDGRVSMLTCISTNALSVYSKARNTKSRARIVRIVYRMQPEDKEKSTFKLVRYELNDLSWESFDEKKIRGYTLLSGIQRFAVICKVPEELKEEEDKQKDKKEGVSFASSPDWHADQREKEGKATIVPQVVEVDMLVTDVARTRQWPLSFAIELPAYRSMPSPQVQQPKPPLPAQTPEKQSDKAQAKPQNGSEKQQPSRPGQNRITALIEQVELQVEGGGALS